MTQGFQSYYGIILSLKSSNAVKLIEKFYNGVEFSISSTIKNIDKSMREFI